jgi:hypothetical protein
MITVIMEQNIIEYIFKNSKSNHSSKIFLPFFKLQICNIIRNKPTRIFCTNTRYVAYGAYVPPSPLTLKNVSDMFNNTEITK